METEEREMVECIDLCIQELNLSGDESNFNDDGELAVKSILTCDLIHSIRMGWTDPFSTVGSVATERSRDWRPRRDPRTVMEWHHDYRCNNYTGFTSSQGGKNHKFTILLDAHEDLENDCKTWLIQKTKCRKYRLTVAKFCGCLNLELVPLHNGLASALVDPKTKKTPYISHTISWRFMVHLGTKYGALQKGLVQDHERVDVVRVRVVVVKKVMELFPRMFMHRRVDVSEAKKYMPKPDTKSIGPKKGNAEAFVAGLDLHDVKDEDLPRRS